MPVALLPPNTQLGLIVSDWSVTGASGVTVRVAWRVTPWALAVMVTVVWLVTRVVVTVKFAEVCPCGTVTEEGTEATDGLLLLSCTVKPPDCAGAVR